MREAPPASYRRTITGFEPVSATAKRFWQETELGKFVRMDGRRPRNLARHNFYWKMLEIAAANIEAFDNAEQLHTAIKATLGYGRWIEVPNASRALFIEDSISFAKMGEAEFAEYLDGAAKAITKHWLRGVAVETLMDETRQKAA